jgi:hypothetical protein
MTKDNYLFEGTREKAVREAQAICDTYVPGKVRVYTEYCDETNAWYMVGAYQSYMQLGDKKAATAVVSDKREKMDRFYDVHIFTHFFTQRAAYMNASYYWQIEACKNNIHPAVFKGWRDTFKRTTSDMVSA